MKTVLGKGWKWLLGLLMGLLGFTGCGKLGIVRVEYGCPNADFKLVGDVKDANGKGIEGIRVVFTPHRDAPQEQQKWDSDTLYSEPDEAKGSAVKFEDVDGTAHGTFKTKVLTASDLDIKRTRQGDKRWYSGEYTIQADAVLEEEE